MPTVSCQRCQEPFLIRATERYLHRQTGEPLPVLCRLCRLLTVGHGHEVQNATRGTTNHTGWSRLFQRQRTKRAAPLTKQERLHATITRWTMQHRRLPRIKDFLRYKTLPSVNTLYRYCGSLAAMHAALGVPEAYLAALRARQQLLAIRAGMRSGTVRRQAARRRGRRTR